MTLDTLLESFDLEDGIELLFRSTRVAVGKLLADGGEGFGMTGRIGAAAKSSTSIIRSDRRRRYLRVGTLVLPLLDVLLGYDRACSAKRKRKIRQAFDQLKISSSYREMPWRIDGCCRGWAVVFRISFGQNKNPHSSATNAITWWSSVRYYWLSVTWEQRFDCHVGVRNVLLHQWFGLAWPGHICCLVSKRQRTNRDRRCRRSNWAPGWVTHRSEMDDH